MSYIRIRNWSRYQHYKDRCPPWVKLHLELLSSETWVCLDDASRVLAIATILLASRTGNKIPYNTAYIKRVAYLNCDPDFEPLLKTQFIEIIEDDAPAQADASAVLALDKRMHTNAEPEAEVEAEVETEKKNAPTKVRGRATPALIPDNWQPNETNRAWLASVMDAGEAERVIGEFVRWAKNSELRKANWDLAFSRNPAVKSAVGRSATNGANQTTGPRSTVERSRAGIERYLRQQQFDR